MSTSSTTRKLGRKAICGMAAAIFTAGVASAALAVAQSGPQPDGDPNPPGPATAPVVTSCGASISSVVTTQNTPNVTSSAFSNLPGAVTSVTVAPGPTRCIKVVLTAETACPQTSVVDVCRVRALIDGAPMAPDGQSFRVIDSESSTAQGHAYEWVQRVGSGAHIVLIQHGVRNFQTQSIIDDWSLDVGVYR
jgi:hypothetical protein